MKSLLPLIAAPAAILVSSCGSHSGDYSQGSQGRAGSFDYLRPNLQMPTLGYSSGEGVTPHSPYASLGNEAPSYPSGLSSSRRRYPSTTYSSDYHVDQTLGGNTRVSDRWGNSTTFDRTLGGNLRSTSNTGETMTYSQNLGGGYTGTSGNGTTYQSRQNLGGGYTIEGSDGSSYSRTQTLGGGYRYEAR